MGAGKRLVPRHVAAVAWGAMALAGAGCGGGGGGPGTPAGDDDDDDVATDGGPDRDAGGRDGGGDPVAIEVEVAAATGGTVRSEDGEIVLEIGPGALEEDTTITLVVSAPSSETLGPIADFGPDGLTFLEPVTLRMPLAASPPEGEVPALAFDDGGPWSPIPSGSDGRTVRGVVEHFTRFAVVATSAGVTAQSCPGDRLAGTGCPSDPTGSAWVLEEPCFDAIIAPLGTACGAPVVGAGDILVEGTLAIDGATFTADFDPGRIVATVTYAAECPPASLACALFGGTEACGELECTCSVDEALAATTWSGPFTRDDGVGEGTVDLGAETATVTYCAAAGGLDVEIPLPASWQAAWPAGVFPPVTLRYRAGGADGGDCQAGVSVTPGPGDCPSGTTGTSDVTGDDKLCSSWLDLETPGPSDPVPAVSPGAVRLTDGRVLVAGGFSADLRDTVDAAMIWTPGGDREFSVLPTLGRARGGGRLVALDDGDALYVGGATRVAGEDTAVLQLERFDGATDTWSDLGMDLPSARSANPVAAYVPSLDRVFVIGGQLSAEASENDPILVDPTTGATQDADAGLTGGDALAATRAYNMATVTGFVVDDRSPDDGSRERVVFGIGDEAIVYDPDPTTSDGAFREVRFGGVGGGFITGVLGDCRPIRVWLVGLSDFRQPQAVDPWAEAFTPLLGAREDVTDAYVLGMGGVFLQGIDGGERFALIVDAATGVSGPAPTYESPNVGVGNFVPVPLLDGGVLVVDRAATKWLEVRAP